MISWKTSDEVSWTNKLGYKAANTAGLNAYFALFDLLYFFDICDPLQGKEFRHYVLGMRRARHAWDKRMSRELSSASVTMVGKINPA